MSIRTLAPSPIGSFPPVYEGELLYSILARYGFEHGYTSGVMTFMDLLGSGSPRPVVDFPPSLRRLAAVLPPRLGLTAEILMRGHTLTPYYAAFLPPPDRTAVEDAVLGDAGKAGVIVGTSAKPVPVTRQLRFCRACLADMAKAGQEPHWKRVHQIPIVTTCPVHGDVLRASTVVVADASRRLERADATVCPPEAPPVVDADAEAAVDFEALRWLAACAANLIEGPPQEEGVRLEAVNLSERLRAHGYARGPNQVDWNALEREARPVLNGIAPAFPDVRRFALNENGWLDRALVPGRKPQTNVVLLASLLIKRMPRNRPKTSLSRKPPKPERARSPKPPASAPTDVNGPWQCLNPFRPHLGPGREPAIMTVMTTRTRSLHFQCRCGHAYRRLLGPRGELGRPTMLLTPTFLQLLLNHSESNCLGIAAAAEFAGIKSTDRLRTALAKNRMPDPWPMPVWKRNAAT